MPLISSASDKNSVVSRAGTWFPQTLLNPMENANQMFFLKSIISSVTMHSNAAHLAKLGAVLANRGSLDGITLLKKDTILEAEGTPIEAYDFCLLINSTMTKGGLGVNILRYTSPDPKWIGWGGFGGSIFLWSPLPNIAISYAPSNLIGFLGDIRSQLLLEITMECAKK